MLLNRKSAAGFVTVMLLLLVLCISGGCGGSSSDSSDNGSRKLSRIGTVHVSYVEALRDSNIELPEYSAEEMKALGRVIIAKVASLTDEQKTAIKEMFNTAGSKRTVALFRPSSSDIDSVRELLGTQETAILQSENLTDVTSADLIFYTICKDASGDIYTQAVVAYGLDAQFPSSDDLDDLTSSEDIDIVEDAEELGETMTSADKVIENKKLNAKLFAEFIKLKRNTDSSAYVQAEPVTPMQKLAAWVKGLTAPDAACADGSVQELADFAQTYQGKIHSTFTNLPGLYIKVNVFLTSVHHFENTGSTTGGKDVYIITQECNFNGAMTGDAAHRHWLENGSYTSAVAKANKEKKKYYPNGAQCDEFYISEYQLESSISGVDDDNITASHVSPQNQVGQKEVSVSSGWSIGAGVEAGVTHKKNETETNVGVSLNYGYTYGKTTSYTTNDIDTILDHTDTNLHWLYRVNEYPKRKSSSEGLRNLTDPADLTIKSYEPWQQFVWIIDTSKRGSYSSYHVKARVNVQGCYSRHSGSRNPQYYTITNLPAEGNITLVKPPLFTLDKDDVEFTSESGVDDKIEVNSQGPWTFVQDEASKSWLTVYKPSSNKTLRMSTQEANATGAYREAKITLKRTNGSTVLDTRTVYVTQSPNAN